MILKLIQGMDILTKYHLLNFVQTENKSFINIHSNNSQESNSSTITNENGYVKLPKLNIQTFYGDCTQFVTFWNTFKTSIHKKKKHFIKSKISLFEKLSIWYGSKCCRRI